MGNLLHTATVPRCQLISCATCVLTFLLLSVALQVAAAVPVIQKEKDKRNGIARQSEKNNHTRRTVRARQRRRTGMPEGVRTQRGQPATKEDLIGVIKKGKQQGKLVSIYTEQIEKNGVDFLLIPPDERKIREVGSYLDGKVLDQLINAVRDNYRARTFLSGHIEQVEVTENSGGGAQVFIRLSVKNAGQATIAHQYSLRIMHATRRSIDFKDRPVELNESFPLRKEGAKDLVIHPQDALALKPNRSIGKGRTESGWLRFIVPELPEFTPDFLRQEGMWYVVSFTDAAGLSYEAHYVW